jgi:ketosteroid isomerase-like protein
VGDQQPGSSDEERVRKGIDAWNRGDWEAALALISPDVEWTIAQPLFDMPEVSHGHEGVIEFWRKWAEIWERIQVDLEDMVAFDGGVAAFCRWRARGRDGVEVDQAVVFAFTIEDGLTTRFTGYWDPDDAIRTLGVARPPAA